MAGQRISSAAVEPPRPARGLAAFLRSAGWAAALGILPWGAAFAAETDPGFHQAASEHFTVHYDCVQAPEGVLSDLEMLHAKLALDLILFAPWAQTEKVSIYIYESSQTFHARTGAPEWSRGQADPARRSVQVCAGPGLRRILAHELAHLFFDDFFLSAPAGYGSERLRQPPVWLSEGVAVNMEWDYGLGQDQAAIRARARDHALPLKDFLAFDYRQQRADGEVSDWYVQAYSLVRYFMRSLPGSLFFEFCDALRRGVPMEQALGRTYGGVLPDIPALERHWRESLRD
ncbi:MAG: hypothetical protein WC881_04090 [Elusimicrobiota bacterium]|jgi:hypothetical protein